MKIELPVVPASDRQEALMGTKIGVALAMGAIVVGLGCGKADDGCTKDSDCKGERVCQAGTCADPWKPSAPVPVATLQEPPMVTADPVPSVQTAKAPAKSKLSCEPCADDCIEKADKVFATDPALAKKLAGRYCNDSCGYIGTARLMSCHGYGFLGERSIDRR